MTLPNLQARLSETLKAWRENPPENAGTHAFLISCTLLMLILILWSTVGRLDIVSTAIGEVVPSSQLKSVQHLEGGIVQEILVREGQAVTAGQSLVVLEPISSGSDVTQLTVRMDALRMTLARLQAQISGDETLTLPEELSAKHPELARQAIGRFETRAKRVRNQLTVQQEKVTQRVQEIHEAQARLDTNRKNLELASEQVKISEKLLKLDLTNRMNHLGVQREFEGLKGKVQEDEALLPRLEAAHGEAVAQLEAVTSGFREESQKEMEGAEVQRQELAQSMLKVEDSLDRTVLKAPTDGVVKTLYVHTIGGVIESGKTVVDIVPAGDRLIIEGKLQTQDVGYVRAGQEVSIQLASSEAVRFGNLVGTVIHVSPDTHVSKDGQPYYLVRIETDQAYFQRGNLRYDLVSGMQVMCSIQTGTRSVLDYLLEPYLGSFSQAMQER